MEGRLKQKIYSLLLDEQRAFLRLDDLVLVKGPVFGKNPKSCREGLLPSATEKIGRSIGLEVSSKSHSSGTS